ncbi:hypothetical protein BofuT4_uP015920.1 [Botrytis cinerea T4]|uniref:Uncharacterized protein n=1 Tax=Botryotinia fuckeliana (strain T4) TaxID=999810 RepID=G2YHU9_BOTF4|nr:hypothetical protein BofuT4_uP015920.1 [Botrytis cinerea T4]
MQRRKYETFNTGKSKKSSHTTSYQIILEIWQFFTSQTRGIQARRAGKLEGKGKKFL